MNIPDIIFGVGGFVFFVALLPSIFSDNKPDAKTSFATAVILTLYCGCYVYLGLWLGLMSGALTALGWWVLFVQKVIKKH